LQVYDGSTSYSVSSSSKKSKEHELTDEEKEGKEFGETFFDNIWSRGSSKSLYDFIKTGFLDKDIFLLEFSATVDDKTAKGMSLSLREQDWFYYTELELEFLINKIMDVLKNDMESSFDSFLKITIHLKNITLHLNRH